jgi:hypothetical protein
MKKIKRRETGGRFFLLSIPDLIRDPEGMEIPLNPPGREKVQGQALC